MIEINDHYIPATPGFHVVEVSPDDELSLVPIIAWQISAFVYPVTIHDGSRHDNPYILQPNGEITDSDRTWHNMDAFKESLREWKDADKSMGTITP